jgi:chromosome segregation ATPase
VSAVAAPARHRLAVTRRQLRDRVAYLKVTLARVGEQASQQAREAHATAADLTRRLAAADALIADREQRLRAATVDLSVLRQQLAAAEGEWRRSSTDLLAARAELANRDAVTVRPWVREADDQPTVPVRTVQSLHEALGARR